jgi:hypothetical protein
LAWARAEKEVPYDEWEVLATPKPIGGLGFIDTRVMNQCLLFECIYKLERGDNNPCCKLLRAKYLGKEASIV